MEARLKRTHLAKVSKDPRRRAARFVPASVLKAVKERSGGFCEFWKPHPKHAHTNLFCMNEAMNQPHHILKRSRGGKHTKENLIDLCFVHHRFIEDNEKWAVEHGYSLPYEGYKP